MVLYLLRHGDAADNPVLHDSMRPLTEVGLQQAQAAANFMKSLRTSLDAIIASPLLRAHQMAMHSKEILSVREFLVSEFLVPGSDQRQLFELLNSLKAESVLLVGHEPHLSATIALLIGGETSARLEMKKASCACLEIRRPIEKGRGMLKWLVTTEQMKLVP